MKTQQNYYEILIYEHEFACVSAFAFLSLEYIFS